MDWEKMDFRTEKEGKGKLFFLSPTLIIIDIIIIIFIYIFIYIII